MIALPVTYLVVGWVWASLVVYFNWRCNEPYTDFRYSFLLWPFDIIRRIWTGTGNVLGSYEGWLNRNRIKNGGEPSQRRGRVSKF